MKTATKPQSKTEVICGIYAIKTANGIYVGQSINILDRAKEHLNGSSRQGGLAKGTHSNRLLQEAWNQNPSSFELYLVQECDRKHLDGLEAYWIKKLGTLNLKEEKARLPWGVKPHNEDKKLLTFTSLMGDNKQESRKMSKPGFIRNILIPVGVAGALLFAANTNKVVVWAAVASGVGSVVALTSKK